MVRILVADDYQPFLDDVVELVADGCTSVKTVTTAVDAVRELDASEFDVVVTDLLMESRSAADGLKVLAAAKRRPFTQVIVVTSFGSPELSVESMRLGAFDYLERGTPGKDFRQMLTSKIRLALDYRSAKLAVAGHTDA